MPKGVQGKSQAKGIERTTLKRTIFTQASRFKEKAQDAFLLILIAIKLFAVIGDLL